MREVVILLLSHCPPLPRVWCRWCGQDGTWTQGGSLDCVPVTCHLPENPLNGKALFSSTDFGATVNYEEQWHNNWIAH